MTQTITPHDRHAELETLLRDAQSAYHDADAPIMDDATYDALLGEQRALEAAHPELTRGATAQVGTPQPGSVTHVTPMQSLDNAFDREDLLEFGERLKRKLHVDTLTGDLSVEPKLDGLSVNVVYEGGVLTRATTRGDGTSGEDITAQARLMGVPERVAAGGTLEVRGEVFMPRSELAAHNAAAVAGERVFKNARNAAVGSLRKGTPERVARLRLAVYGAGALGDLQTRGVSTQLEFFAWARAQGFTTAPGTVVVSSLEDAWTAHAAMQAARDTQDFDADGTVIKLNAFADQVEAGRNSRAPAWAIAVKFEAQSVTTVLEDVIFATGRTGLITPTALLRPVDIEGSTVSRATLHNADYLAALDLHVGDTVTLHKAGGVIPKVGEVVLALRPEHATRVVMPSTCPVCGHSATRVEGEAGTFCVNPQCPSQAESQLRHVVASDVLDIQHLGESVVSALYASGVTEYTQLYALDVATLAALQVSGGEGKPARALGEKTAAKIHTEITRSRSTDLWRHIRALGMGHTGKGTSTRLARQFSSLNELAQVAGSEGGLARLMQIDDIGKDTAGAIVTHFTTGPGQGQVQRLTALGVTPLPSAQQVSGTALSDLKIVVTGTLSTGRDVVEAWLAQQGASVGGSVTGKTSHLLAGDKAGSKIQKAQEKGVTVLDEAAMRELCTARGLTWLA